MRDATGRAIRAIEPESAITVTLAVLGDSRGPLDVVLRWRTRCGALLFESWSPLPPAPEGEPRRLGCHFPRFPLRGDVSVLGIGLRDPAYGEGLSDTARVELPLGAAEGALLRLEHAWAVPEARPAARAAPQRHGRGQAQGTDLVTSGGRE